VRLGALLVCRWFPATSNSKPCRAHLNKFILCFFTPNVFWILDTFDHIFITLAGDAGNYCLPRNPLLLLVLRPVTLLAEAAPQACTAVVKVVQVSCYVSCQTKQAVQEHIKQLLFKLLCCC
jgi:hypothetical protein